MRRPYYKKPPWYLKIRAIIAQFLLPLIIFQFFRTLFFPTSFDVILLTFLIFLYCCMLIRLF
ncbi:hypothetical protein P4637_06500 [Halalkalibacterium halodurans]|uniref:BH3039 protein n=2 Tax=Halalkalibacterium halodurans TaxID=86665 RepID=Q9K8G7_HALH5|nr:hypothetical protein [Halalkalibacterium halodurans]MDY7223585.1 hypothetical protein [Halalkalibacterium halodurans]MDY7242806.1 hypothetical protein [Halalkalibacterium halodurans]MED3646604.1 hypothetical protein [Halalkalibacterium halodurans]MED4082207.1 hypothetical protein [Halalkalibacterium halodurans]MED4084514.1 hypothetical protein [Halalkalibacterium halodurans]